MADPKTATKEGRANGGPPGGASLARPAANGEVVLFVPDSGELHVGTQTVPPLDTKGNKAQLFGQLTGDCSHGIGATLTLTPTRGANGWKCTSCTWSENSHLRDACEMCHGARGTAPLPPPRPAPPVEDSLLGAAKAAMAGLDGDRAKYKDEIRTWTDAALAQKIKAITSPQDLAIVAVYYTFPAPLRDAMARFYKQQQENKKARHAERGITTDPRPDDVDMIDIDVTLNSPLGLLCRSWMDENKGRREGLRTFGWVYAYTRTRQRRDYLGIEVRWHLHGASYPVLRSRESAWQLWEREDASQSIGLEALPRYFGDRGAM